MKPLLLAALTTLLVLAGCGSDGSVPVAGDPASTTTTTAETSSTPTSSPAPSTLTASDSTTPITGDVAECTAEELSASLSDDAGGGTAGTVYRTLLLTNVGTAPCFVVGFGGVSYVDASGAQIGKAADRIGAAGPAVALQPGDAAGEQLAETEAGNFDATDCRPTQVDRLRVYPPDSTQALFVEHRVTGCANTGVPLLVVSGYAAVR